MSPDIVANSFEKNKFPQKKITGEMGKSKKAGKTLAHTKEQTPLLPLSGNLQENLEASPCTTACSVVKDASTGTATNSSFTPTASRVSGTFPCFLARNKYAALLPHSKTLYDVRCSPSSH
jgi:hypothetical protein